MPRPWTHAQDSAHAPAAPQASPVWFLQAHGRVAVKVTDKTELCIACPRERPYFCFLNSSYLPPEIDNFLLCKRNTGLHWEGLSPTVKQVFIHVSSSTCLCPLRPCYRLSCLVCILSGCEQKDRAECHTPPLPPAGFLVSALDTKTNRLCPSGYQPEDEGR